MDLFGATVRPVHFVAGVSLLALIPFRRRQALSGAVKAVTVFTVSVAVLSIAPLATHQDAGRVFLPGLIVLNAWLCVIAIELTNRQSGDLVAIEAAFLAIMVVPLVQAAAVIIGANEPFHGAGMLPFSRTPGTFEEATWLGSVAALVLGYAVERRHTALFLVSSLGILIAASRASIVIGAGVVAMRVIRLASIRRMALVGALIVGWTFTPISHALLFPSADYSSLDSRILDQRTTVETLSGEEWLLGGEDLRIVDENRSRVLPATSNNVFIDMIWKQGIIGIAVLACVYAFLIVMLPRAIGVRDRLWNSPAMLMATYGTMVLWVVNNSMLRPWFWILAGVALASAVQARRDHHMDDA